MIAANKGHVNIVKALIEHGADIEAQLNPPSLLNALAMAVRSDNSNKLPVIKLLLQSGADVTKKFTIAKIGISELTLNEGLKNFLALTTICRNENLINTPHILDKHLHSFLKWKSLIKPYDIEFKAKPLKLHLKEIYNLNEYLKTLEHYKDSKELNDINKMLDCFSEIKEALGNNSKPTFKLTSLMLLEVNKIKNFFCKDLSKLPKLPNKKFAEKVKEAEIYKNLEKSYPSLPEDLKIVAATINDPTIIKDVSVLGVDNEHC